MTKNAYTTNVNIVLIFYPSPTRSHHPKFKGWTRHCMLIVVMYQQEARKANAPFRTLRDRLRCVEPILFPLAEGRGLRSPK